MQHTDAGTLQVETLSNLYFWDKKRCQHKCFQNSCPKILQNACTQTNFSHSPRTHECFRRQMAMTILHINNRCEQVSLDNQSQLSQKISAKSSKYINLCGMFTDIPCIGSNLHLNRNVSALVRFIWYHNRSLYHALVNNNCISSKVTDFRNTMTGKP